MGSHLINEEKTWWNDATCLRGVLRNVYFLLFFWRNADVGYVWRKKNLKSTLNFFSCFFLSVHLFLFLAKLSVFEKQRPLGSASYPRRARRQFATFHCLCIPSLATTFVNPLNFCIESTCRWENITKKTSQKMAFNRTTGRSVNL